jgi:hypothetical protein
MVDGKYSRQNPLQTFDWDFFSKSFSDDLFLIIFLFTYLLIAARVQITFDFLFVP